MDLRTLVTVSTLLLLTDAEKNITQPAANDTSPSDLTKSSDPTCLCTGAPPTGPAAPTPGSSALHLRHLTVRWNGCLGYVKLIGLGQSGSLSDVCHDSLAEVKDVLWSVCEGRSGCSGPIVWKKGQHTADSYNIRAGSVGERISCDTLKVQCSVVQIPDVEGQLQAYKVVTALLCCVLLVLLMVRFTRPTVNALQKRLSDRRQNRWIGPTQSHSVSYNRGKNTVKNNDPEKRVSYPGLERLTVVSSREPSSSRNSYNF